MDGESEVWRSLKTPFKVLQQVRIEANLLASDPEVSPLNHKLTSEQVSVEIIFGNLQCILRYTRPFPHLFIHMDHTELDVNLSLIHLKINLLKDFI